jgi:phage terminase large subunit GpA-like protein
MDVLSVRSPIRRVVVLKAAQLGVTEAALNWLGYVIEHAPAPFLYVAPTVETAKRLSRHKLDQLIEATPALRRRVRSPRSRDSANTILLKVFPGGVVVLTGANSAVGLRSMSCRFVVFDEVDGYGADVEGEGDPIRLVEARTRSFPRRKLLLISTPTVAEMHATAGVDEYRKTASAEEYSNAGAARPIARGMPGRPICCRRTITP